MSATWTAPGAAAAPAAPAAPAGRAVATSVLVLALANEGVWQQRGADGQREGGEEGQEEGQGDGAAATQELPLMNELDVEWRPSAQRQEELLQTVRQHRVRRLTNVDCDEDPAWSLRLLRLAAPHLEELQVEGVRGDHLLAVHAMPKLNRLSVEGDRDSREAFPAELPPLPAHHAGLRWLSVSDLPYETTFSLIRAHAGTLEELEFEVDTPGGGDCPEGRDDLPATLGRCGLARLRALVFGSLASHDEDLCPAQLSAVRAALPRVRLVLCDDCDDVSLDF